MYNSFVTGFSGRRDSYEFAVALFEANILKKHVCDLYTLDWTKKYLGYLDNNIFTYRTFTTRKLSAKANIEQRKNSKVYGLIVKIKKNIIINKLL